MSRINETGAPFPTASGGGPIFDLPPIMPGWPNGQATGVFDASLASLPFQYPAPPALGYYGHHAYPHLFHGGGFNHMMPPMFPAAPASAADLLDAAIWAAQAAAPTFGPEGEGHPHLGEATTDLLDEAIRQNQELKALNQSLAMELEEYRQRNTSQARGRSSSPRRPEQRGMSPRQRSPYQTRGDRRHSSSPRRPCSHHRSSPSRSLSRTPPGYMTPHSRSRSVTRERSGDHQEPMIISLDAPTINSEVHDPLKTLTISPLISRITPRDTAPVERRGLNRTRHIGLNKPRNLSNQFLHGRWKAFVVSTLEDCDVLYEAAEYDDKALLYLDYCNAIYQRPEATKTEGMRALIARWNTFIRIHRTRRDQLRELNAVPVKIASRRRPNSSHSTRAAGTTAVVSNHITPIEIAALCITDSRTDTSDPPPRYDTLTATSSIVNTPDSDSAASPTPTLEETPITGPSPADWPWALGTPEHWPFGVRAVFNGTPVPVTENMHGTECAPYEADVKGWGWLEGLAPARDGIDDTRYDQFMHIAVTNLSLPVITNAALSGQDSFSALPIEHFPFDTSKLDPTTVAQWLHEHGVSRESEDMAAIHGYALQVSARFNKPKPASYIPPPTPDEWLDYGEESE
ncbi:hypothetical protein HWV62_24806 [Athelia sp. TMB]|nr:hypothetical protein HWV62_24806 [Athelia sp. TMB]